MPENPVTRRMFVAAAGAAPAAAAAQTMAGGRQPVVVAPYLQSNIQAQQQPLKIVTMYRFEPDEVRKIQSVTSTKVEIEICATREEFRQKLRDAEVVYGDLRGSELDLAPKLKWIQAGGAGVEGMLDDAHRRSPVVITNYARTFAPGISETAMGLLLCLTRGLATYYMPQFYKRQMNPVGTPKSAHHVELAGRKMGIVGMGGIGSAVARRAYYGFDMRIVGTDARPIPKPEYVEVLRDPSWFMEMVPQVDVLVCAAPHTKLTEGMFNEQVFRRMKKTAYFLALSRGKLFDDMALVKALKEGWIAGAGLDVFPQEPPPSSHPIFDCPNVVMSAHTSGWSPDRQVRLIELFAENVRRYVNGYPLINVVDKQAGY
ncbi:MAG: D-2-hydroxyacid dehydrogenase [Bryobacteraceae bacterium]|nr:D-2-hydroxyacid dehydrogenase [Bryobacteraceae bacterium]MDW8377312.1 D-2-hydroxyacid dehydrogenase [Bryobacterales bacterium]